MKRETTYAERVIDTYMFIQNGLKNKYGTNCSITIHRGVLADEYLIGILITTPGKPHGLQISITPYGLVDSTAKQYATKWLRWIEKNLTKKDEP